MLNWNNPIDWENYYQEKDGEIDFFYPAYFDFCKDYEFEKIWFPGCGLSSIPIVFSKLGFKVWATDISETALKKQKEFANLPFIKQQEKFAAYLKIDEFKKMLKDDEAIYFKNHNFFYPFLENEIDCILNIRAFHGFSLANMQKTANVHYRALKKQGHAVFEIHLPGGPENELEKVIINVLQNAGFYTIEGYGGLLIPFSEKRICQYVTRRTRIECKFSQGRLLPTYKTKTIWGKIKYRFQKKRLESYDKFICRIRELTSGIPKECKIAHIL